MKPPHIRRYRLPGLECWGVFSCQGGKLLSIMSHLSVVREYWKHLLR